MQPRAILRVLGRLFIVGFIAMLAIDMQINREPTHVVYMERYDNFRNLLFFARIIHLPPSKFIQGLLDYFYWIDFFFLIDMAIMVLLSTRVGGRMMIFYFCFKLAIWYLPVLCRVPKASFNSKDTMNVVKIITFLGLAIGLTASPQASKRTATVTEQEGKSKQE